ncbi:MAG: hypothetical protein ACRDEB_06450, partial [Chitinophagaceae bacterium]
MRSVLFSFLGIIPLLLLSPGNNGYKNIRPHYRVQGTSRWTGTLVLDQKYEGNIGTSERHVKVTFINALPTLDRDGPDQGIIDPDSVTLNGQDTTRYDLDFTDDKGSGNVTYHAES